MSEMYQFDEYMANARETLKEGNADTAMDWVDQALSLSRHLEEESIAQAYHLKAQIMIAEEEYSEAEELLQKSLDMFRRNLEGHLLLGEVMLLDGRDEQAASAFESALEIDPQSVRARCLLIFCHCQSGNHRLSKECFDKCVELDPELADSYYHMGICFFHQGKPEATEFFRKALLKNPVLSGPHYYLGRIKMAEGDFHAAQTELNKELELNPANSLAELELIRLYLLGVGWQEAVELFDGHFPPEILCDIPALTGCRFHFNYELVEEKFKSFINSVKGELPQTPDNVFRVAKLYRHKSLFGEAAEHLKKVIEDDRSFRPAYGELAELYQLRGDFGRASELLQVAAATFGDAEAYWHLSGALLSSGSYSEAEEAARKAVSLGPNLPEPHYLLGAILADAASRAKGSDSLMQEAKNSLQKALEIDPHYAAARTYLMHIAFQQGKYDECLEVAGQALNENAEDRMALSYSGRCFHATGNLIMAEEHLRKLVELHPDDRAGRAALAEVYRAQKKFREAAEELEQAIGVPERRTPPDFLFRLGEIYLLHLNKPTKAREFLLNFLQTAQPGHPNIDRATSLLGTIKP